MEHQPVPHADRDGSEEPPRDELTELLRSGDGQRTNAFENAVIDTDWHPVIETRREWSIKFQDGSVSKVCFNGRTAESRARREAFKLALRFFPDRIRVVSRPVYVGEWEEVE